MADDPRRPYKAIAAALAVVAVQPPPDWPPWLQLLFQASYAAAAAYAVPNPSTAPRSDAARDEGLRDSEASP